MFANFLKLEMGITVADVDAATAKTAIESAVTSGVFTSNADNAKYALLSDHPMPIRSGLTWFKVEGKIMQ